MRQKKLILLLLVIFFVTGICFALTVQFFLIKDVRIVYAEFNVTDHIGLVGDIDALRFGGLIVPSSSMKDMKIEMEQDAFVFVKATGPIKDFLYITGPSRFSVRKGEIRMVEFTVEVPDNTTLGKREGTVYFYFVHPIARYFFE
ncbi:MAG: hypothetical protein V1659_02645 [Candidatus Woesearchaeota archaeon]